MGTKAVMKAVNIQAAKTYLSSYLEDVEKGGVIQICRHNKPVAEIRRIAPAMEEKAPEFGIYDGFGVSPEFFEPLPDTVTGPFEGL